LNQLKKKYGIASNKRHHTEQKETTTSEIKRVRLADEVREQPANVKENQKLVDAFLEYGERQLSMGHTGKGSTHLRAAREIRNYDKPINSIDDAYQVGFVGQTMAQQVGQILKQGKIQDQSEDKNVRSEYHRPQIVRDIRAAPAKCTENQGIVDALTDYGEHELQYGNTGKAVSHLRAAKEIHNSSEVIESADDARKIPMVSDVIVDKIQQILSEGKITHETDISALHKGVHALILQEIRAGKAKVKENQKIVDALADYGESQLQKSNRGRGISHLRAAREIMYSDHEIKSASDAHYVGMVGDTIAPKVDQILKKGKIEETEEDESEGQVPRSRLVAPIVQDLRENKAVIPENQTLVNRLTDYGENNLYHGYRGKGISHLRAAKEIRNSNKVINSVADAEQIGSIGKKIAQKVEQILTRGTANDDVTYGEMRDEEGSEEVEEVSENEEGVEYGPAHPAPIVQDLRSTPAKCLENQELVDALTDFGDEQLRSGHTGRGISHLRAAIHIRNSQHVIKSSQDAMKEPMVGKIVAAKIDEILSEE
jgi:DNA polymerase/3'-5' exonuclease PolX